MNYTLVDLANKCINITLTYCENDEEKDSLLNSWNVQKTINRLNDLHTSKFLAKNDFVVVNTKLLCFLFTCQLQGIIFRRLFETNKNGKVVEKLMNNKIKEYESKIEKAIMENNV